MKKEKTAVVQETVLDSSLKLIVKTSFIVFIGLFLSKILGYAYRIIIARYFGPEVYGLFSLAITIGGLCTSLAAFGYSDGLLRYIPLLRAKNKTNEINYLIRKTLKFYIVAGIASAILLFVLSDFIAVTIFHDFSLSIFIKVIGLNVLLSLLLNIYLCSLRSFEHIGWYSFIFNIFQNVARVGLLLLLILMGLKSSGSIVVWAYVFASVLTLIFSYIVARYKISQMFQGYKKQDYSKINSEFFHYSWPIVFYSIVGLLFYWIDSFSLGFYKSAYEVGLYNAAVPIAMLIAIVPEIFMQLFFPMITREYSSKNYELIKSLSKQVSKWIFIAYFHPYILLSRSST
jgi:O-antigen/teichoic acid export membrane protein